MIYPRLKLKSEVFANILDGTRTEFNIENDEEVPLPEENEDDVKRLEKEAKLIEKTMVTEQNPLQQTNIQDFFFGSGHSSSKRGPENDTESTNITTVNGTETCEEPRETAV